MKKGNRDENFLKECIRKAFVTLLKEKKPGDITVTEIAARAGVSRMTYYRNYLDKEDIIREHIAQLVNDYRLIADKQAAPDGRLSYENVAACFEYFETYADYLRQYIASGFGSYIEEAVTDYILTWFPSEHDWKKRYILHAYAGAICHVYTAWLADAERHEPHETAGLIYEIFSDFIRE